MSSITVSRGRAPRCPTPMKAGGGPPSSAKAPPSVQDIYDLNAERGISPYNRKIVNTTSLVYELPFGQGRRYLNSKSRAAEVLLGESQITAISSVPVTFTYSPGTANELSPLDHHLRPKPKPRQRQQQPSGARGAARPGFLPRPAPVS